MKSWMKAVAGIMAVALFSVMGYLHEAGAATTNLPSLSVGTHKTFTFVPSATTPYISNIDSKSDPLTTTTSTITKDSVIYGMKLLTIGGTNCSVGLYNEDDIADLTPSAVDGGTVVVDELTEATQYKMAVTDWVSPRKLTVGFTLITYGLGTVVVYYD